LRGQLPSGVDPCGERGEFHTCVYDGPIFRQPLVLRTGERLRRDGRFEYCDVMLGREEPLGQPMEPVKSGSRGEA
jgi:diphthamide synthase (EF-2-diphthine--ammonia ligase)